MQLLLHDPAAFLALLHVVELAAGLLDSGVKESHPSQFIDQAAALAVTHRDDAGDVALHHHVAALGVDAQPAELSLQLLKVAGLAISGVAAAVGAPWHHPQFAGHRPLFLIGFDPGPFLWRLNALFGGIRLPVAEVKAHAHQGLGRFACFENAAVNQVGQPVGTHAPAVG